MPAQEQATFTVPREIPAGEAQISIEVQGHPERPAARVLSEQGEQPPLRGDAARGDRRAPHVPVVRRAGVQGHVHAYRDDRHGDHAISNGAVVSDHARARRRQAHRDVRDHAEDVHLSRRAGRRRFRLLRRAAPTASRSASARRRTRRALTGLALEAAAEDHALLQQVLRHQVSVREARHRRRAGLRRRRDGEHRRDLLSRDGLLLADPKGASVQVRRRTSPASSRTRWRTSGSATSSR